MSTVNLAKIKYYVIAALSNGSQIHLEEVAENIAWEENENELATRLNLTLKDVPYGDGRLSTAISLCTAIYVYYNDGSDDGTGRKEVFRGTVWEWEHSRINDDDIILTAYDLLYYLQKSKDNAYFEKGTGTSGICGSLLSKWGVALGEFSGPSITHEKVLYKNKTISAMLTETLDAAEQESGTKYVIRAKEGKCEIVKPGSNSEIWRFTASTNLIASRDSFSMASLVTRVVIYGKEDNDGRPKIEATINGKTEYGVLQEIVNVGSSTIDEAKSNANGIIKDRGEPQRTISLQSPDAPWIRKGDKIFAETDTMSGYFCVLSVAHNATSATMQMEVEPA